MTPSLHPKPRATITRRVIASFAVTVLAFAFTLGLGVVAQRRAADDSVELARGYVPVAMRLAQLRAAQTTLSTLVDGIPDEREPGSTRVLLDTLAGARRTMFVERRAALTQTLPAVGSDATRAVAPKLAADLDAIEASIDADPPLFELLFSRPSPAPTATASTAPSSCSAPSSTTPTRDSASSQRKSPRRSTPSRTKLGRESSDPSGRSPSSASSRSPSASSSRSTSAASLSPLGRVTPRAGAVARGDLTAREVEPSDDEIGQLEGAFEKMVTGLARAQALALSNERLAAIGKMAAHVTHEIRNPLSAMGLNVELLAEEIDGLHPQDGPRRAEVANLLAAIQREAQRLEQR